MRPRRTPAGASDCRFSELDCGVAVFAQERLFYACVAIAIAECVVANGRRAHPAVAAAVVAGVPDAGV